MRDYLTVTYIVTGAYIASALGGWDTGLQTLFVFMAIDYISGLSLAGIFKKSKKSDTGALSSKCSWQGLAKKGMQLLIVMIAYRLDIMLGINFVRTAVIIAFISNELISITENAGLMGIPIPDAVSKAIDILNREEKTK